jgi:subtilase family serine protease
LRRAYKIQNTESQAIIAVVVAYGYANAQQDLAVYRAKFHLPPCTTTAACFIKFDEIGQPLNYPPEDLGWSQESALDLDMASAICPSCKIYLIEADTSRFSDLAQAENTAARLGAHAISNSYGGPESGTGSMESAYNHPGIAITASSGDSGGGVQFPASSPHVTAVGGTHLVRDASARGWNETGWGNGGGCSSVYAKPTWQTDPLCTMRTVSDVAAVADPATGVAVYGPVTTGHPAWLVFGGTSVAAPIIAGVYAVNGRPVKYGSDPYVPTGHLFDIVSGPAGSCGTYLCTTGPGYDGPTGLGTPNGVAAF